MRQVNTNPGELKTEIELSLPKAKKKKKKKAVKVAVKAPQQKILSKQELATAYVIRMAGEIRKLVLSETGRRKEANLEGRRERYKEIMMEKHGVTRASLDYDAYTSSGDDVSVDSEAEEEARRLAEMAEEEMHLQEKLEEEVINAAEDEAREEALEAQVQDELAELEDLFDLSPEEEAKQQDRKRAATKAKNILEEEATAAQLEAKKTKLSPDEMLAKRKAKTAAERAKRAEDAAAQADLDRVAGEGKPAAESKSDRAVRKKKDSDDRSKRKKAKRRQFDADQGVAQAMYYSVMEGN